MLVARANLEKGSLVAGPPRQAQHPVKQAPAGTAATQRGVDAQIEDVRLARAHGEDAVAAEAIAILEDTAVIADPQTVPEDALAPRKCVTLDLDANHLMQVGITHAPLAQGLRQGSDGETGVHGAAGRGATCAIANWRSSQALRFSAGARSR